MKRNQNQQPKKQVYAVQVLCAWCKEKSWTTESSTPVEGISHGICPECNEQVQQTIPQTKKG